MPTSTVDADRDRATGVRADGWQRRGAGIIVLAALLVVLIVVAAVRDRRLPGEPTAAPVAAAPQVGDCIQEDPHDRGADLYPAKTPFAALRSGDCSAPRFGEVVSMAPGYPDGIRGAQHAPSSSAFSRRTATSGCPLHRCPRSFPSDRRSRCGPSWLARTTGNAPPGRTGRRAWCSCLSPPMRPHRSPSITRCGAPGTGRKTADCSALCVDEVDLMIRELLVAAPIRSHQPQSGRSGGVTRIRAERMHPGRGCGARITGRAGPRRDLRPRRAGPTGPRPATGCSPDRPRSPPRPAM